MSATTPSLSDILNNVITAVANVVNSIAQAIANNASTLGTVLVLAAMGYVVFRYGRRLISGVAEFFRGIF